MQFGFNGLQIGSPKFLVCTAAPLAIASKLNKTMIRAIFFTVRLLGGNRVPW